MRAITLSSIRGRSVDWVIHDDLMDAMPKHWADKSVKPTSWTLADFDMCREGRKQYAFYRRNGTADTQRYRCSYVEAKRRFTLFLITKRLTS